MKLPIFRLTLVLLLCYFTHNAKGQNMTQINAKGLEQLAHALPDSGKTIVLNCWASWCGPCIKEMPYFYQADTSLKGENYEFIFVSFDDIKESKQVGKFIQKNKIPGKHYLIEGYSTEDFFELIHPKWQGGIPFTLVLTASGIRYHEGKFESYRQFWQFIHE